MNKNENPLIQALKNKSKMSVSPEDLLKFVLENYDLVPKGEEAAEGENETAGPPGASSNIVTTQESHSA